MPTGTFVHHGFTAANAVHQAVGEPAHRSCYAGSYQGALKVFLKLPAVVGRHAGAGPVARFAPGVLDQQGMVDEGGGDCYDHVTSGGDPSAVLAARIGPAARGC